MGRPERPLDPDAGPVQAFAAELRKLRREAGNPKYLHMQRIGGRSRTALAEAAGGDHLATWETVEAYVRACGADPVAWQSRWKEVRDAVRPRPAGAELGRQDDGDSNAVSGRRRIRPALALALTGLVAVTAIGAFYVTNLARPIAHTSRRVSGKAMGPRTVVVQNMVAIGSSHLVEDSTPAYLSLKPIPFCAEHNCEIQGNSDVERRSARSDLHSRRRRNDKREHAESGNISKQKWNILCFMVSLYFARWQVGIPFRGLCSTSLSRGVGAACMPSVREFALELRTDRNAGVEVRGVDQTPGSAPVVVEGIRRGIKPTAPWT